MTQDPDLGLLQNQLSRYRILYLVVFNKKKVIGFFLSLFFGVKKISQSVSQPALSLTLNTLIFSTDKRISTDMLLFLQKL